MQQTCYAVKIFPHVKNYSTEIFRELYKRLYDLQQNFKRNSRTLTTITKKSTVFQEFQGREKPVMNFKYFQSTSRT